MRVPYNYLHNQFADIERGIRERAAMLNQGGRKLSKSARCLGCPTKIREICQLNLACFQRRDELLEHLIRNEFEAKGLYPVAPHLQKPKRALGLKEG